MPKSDATRAHRATTPVLATIGYEGTTVPRFLETLQDAEVGLLVDVRAVAASRRPGFSKSRLAENLGGVGIGYVHLRGLGTPADGRAAARAGRHREMHRIFGEHLESGTAQADLHALADLVRGGTKVAILCFEADPTHCHRSLVARALGELLPIEVEHLRPEVEVD